MVKQRKDRPNNVSRHFTTGTWRRFVEALGLRQARIVLVAPALRWLSRRQHSTRCPTNYPLAP